MITSIYGILETIRADYAIIRVGGFGIRVAAPTSTLNHLGEAGAEVALHTHFHMREDGITLFGFTTETDRDAFEQLIGVNGVGPKVALAILSIMDAQTFYRAIADEDQQRLGQARGVGKRLAAQLILELKGKLPTLPSAASAGDTATASGGHMQAEAIEALVGLGFSHAEAQAALTKIPPDQQTSLEQIITQALRIISR